MAERQIRGLSSEEARRRISETGPNRIYRSEKISFLRIAGHEVTEPMILLLFVVGFFYSFWGRLLDSVTIFTVIALLILAEVNNEYRAKKTIASLEKITASGVRVFRDGGVAEIEKEEVVPGDILVLTPGTDVAADAEIEKGVGVQADESALTGESFPQDKKKGDMIYAGTVVLSGEGEAKVFATGENTRLGQIARTLKQVKPPRTPLQLAMKSLAGKLVFVAVFFSILIPVLGILRGEDIKTMVLTGLSLAFATIPEELPIIITMVLGLGAYTLSRKKFLVKRLKGAETMGNATVIVTDKTGTITEGKMRIVSVVPADRKKEILGKAAGSLSEHILQPMEKEVRNAAGRLNADASFSGAYRQRNLGAGNRNTKAVIRRKEDRYELYLSGAPEEVFDACDGISEKIGDELDAETGKGRRVIAVAFRQLHSGEEDLDFTELEKGMTFIGLIGFEDSPRKGVEETIGTASAAGIRTIMVTGDHSGTAGFIAGEVGIKTDRIATGKEVDEATDDELRELVKAVSVFSRATPLHKHRIVEALQKNGEVVAVTGDGVNDVLALKGADIGIAMGVRGTDVAKDAADVVLADDNYITITQGIFEGRKFFDNLRKGITYYLSVKTALVLIFLLPVIVGVPMPFSPIQIIVLELFMDLAASAGFVAEPKESGIYRRPPRNPREDVFSGRLVKKVLLNGFVLFCSVMFAYFYARYMDFSFGQTQTLAFSAWIFGHIILAFIARSDTEPVFSIGLFKNGIMNVWAVSATGFLLLGIYVPFLRERFHLAPIGPVRLLTVALVTLCVVGFLEVKKDYRYASD
ncbi:MAG: cation-transporting P-type ATPase [Candidatus Sulfobium sp.]|jgi:Ca2+-transporting ATPase